MHKAFPLSHDTNLSSAGPKTLFSLSSPVARHDLFEMFEIFGVCGCKADKDL